MKKKSPKPQKSIFIKWNHKLLTFLLFVFICPFIYSQNLNATKLKTVPNDSLNKDKIFNLQQELIPDSLFIGTGSFKFYKKNAHASYYANKFHNHKTASGKRYDKNKLTAAHKKLPFGTIVKVTNEANGKSIIVEINDRGPFVRSREIDLSRRAFMDIASNASSGNMKVTLEILQK